MAFNGIKKDRGLTTGNITLGLLWFAVPMILGNLLQQFYNIADTLIVGQFLGANALAAVGSAYSLMIFLTSVLLGLCMGSGAIFSLQYGAGDREALKRSIFVSLVLIGLVTLVLNVAVFVWIDPILRLLQVPEDVYPLMRDYLWVIFWGLGFTFIYNYYASLLRAIGNSVVPLWFLGVAVVLNIALDLIFILWCDWGVKGAAWATVIAQAVSGVGLCVYTIRKFPEPMTMERLLDYGSISPEAADLLKTLVAARYNIFVSGGTGAGKTTFLNALSEFIPPGERVITIEDAAELQLNHIENLVRMETREANAEGAGAIGIGELIRAALRMRPDRLIIGEVRGKEALDLLQSLNTGHDGGFSSGHAVQA